MLRRFSSALTFATNVSMHTYIAINIATNFSFPFVCCSQIMYRANCMAEANFVTTRFDLLFFGVNQLILLNRYGINIFIIDAAIISLTVRWERSMLRL
jgi:hypothetical protein